MNIAMLFPSYRLFLQAERSYVESAVDTIESCLKAVPRQNLVYLFAEDTTARHVYKDIPRYNFIQLTLEEDLDSVSILENPILNECRWVTPETKVNPYRMATDKLPKAPEYTENYRNAFAVYYKKYLETSVESFMEYVDLIVEFVTDMRLYKSPIKVPVSENKMHLIIDLGSGTKKLYVSGQEIEMSDTDALNLLRGGY